jgi:hypothetical protein
MARTRTAIAAVLATVVLVATACYPPSQNPTNQVIPPGGRVVATGPLLTEMRIEDATDDLSRILYGQTDFVYDLRVPARFWVYDDDTGTTTQVPVGRAELGHGSLSPDGRFVVFASNDRSLQVGPTAVNCVKLGVFFEPDVPFVCNELYLFDLDTGERRQLTGLDGSSVVDHSQPTFTADGRAIEFRRHVQRVWSPSSTYHRLDLATGEVQDATPTPAPTTWDRGSHVVTWDAATSTLTSQDTTTGGVETLWADSTEAEPYRLRAAIGGGRLIVLSYWKTERLELFQLVDTETGRVRKVVTPWISADGSQFAVVQLNVVPDATDRLILAPLPD